ncbi:putative glycosyltransferase C06E1.7 [Aphelenchoides besseyi]|nr:putative glycosyltransferase C06E1.7 [Aphelenchoides besseyi]
MSLSRTRMLRQVPHRLKAIFIVLVTTTVISIVFICVFSKGEITPDPCPFLCVEKTLHRKSNDLTTLKQLSMNVQNNCGGVANMIFRIASMYGIAKQTNRSPCLEHRCVANYKTELYSTFHNLRTFPLKDDCSRADETEVRIPEKTSRYFEEVSGLKDYENADHVYLAHGYLQNHRYFHSLRNEIIELFAFSDEMKRAVDDYVSLKMFKTAEERASTKICVHLRGTDFITNKNHVMLPTDLEFTLSAIHFLTQKLQTKRTSIILFSEDDKLVRTAMERLKITNTEAQVYYPTSLERLAYVEMGSRFCDHLILTSSASTFGYWIGYLMPDDKQSHIYYNSLIFKPRRWSGPPQFVEANFFPAEWNRLLLIDRNTSTIEHQDRKQAGRHI